MLSIETQLLRAFNAGVNSANTGAPKNFDAYLDSISDTCGCRACGDAMSFAQMMIICSTCGNKRCPHASNHVYPCTGSNDPGQLGSVYE